MIACGPNRLNQFKTRVSQGDGVRAESMERRVYVTNMNKLRQRPQKVKTDNGSQYRPTIDPLPAWKRGLDLTGASCGLLVLSPLLLLIAAYIKLASKGPVLFKHRRYGYLGQSFYVWKFRSMQTAADPLRHQEYVKNMVQDDVQLTKMNNDAQLIPLGKWLRSSGIDELPQLFNVLKAEMSLVGPRPDVIPIDDYQDWQKIRFAVLPGLTGLWQISGKNHTTFNEMNQLDANYIDKRSLWLDLKIVVLTVPAILKMLAEDFWTKKKF